jgi:hypothetical protein
MKIKVQLVVCAEDGREEQVQDVAMVEKSQTSPTFPLHQCGMTPTVPRTPPEVSSMLTF